MLLFLIIIPYRVHAETLDCPEVSDLEETTEKDRQEFMEALEGFIKNIYISDDEYGHLYEEWEVITAKPFPDTESSAYDEIYYEMAKNFCGEEVANRSWLTRIYFPKWSGISASNLEGQLFVAKSKENGWFVWFRYH